MNSNGVNPNRLRERRQRADHVNQLVDVIGQCGRKFFFDSRSGRLGRMVVDDRCRLWWQDENTGKSIYLHYRYWGQPAFSNGGTLRSLVDALKIYVMSGETLRATTFGPWPDWISGGDPWGYGSDIHRVRQAALDLGILTATAVGGHHE